MSDNDNGGKIFLHSVTLDLDKCKGCINCIKRCPTEAIRVRDGKASIISELCIDCGQCIRVCQNKAKKANYDDLSVLDNFEYTVALPPPSLYAQFNNIDDQKIVLDALKAVGFDDVFEVAAAAEIITAATERYLTRNKGRLKYPVISTACLVVTRLISVRYPDLLDNLLPLITPVELAGKMAKKRASEKTGLSPDKIGCIFLTPCPAKVSAIHSPIGTEHKYVDAAIAINEVYPLLLKEMKKLGAELPDQQPLAGAVGLGWGIIGGESTSLKSTDKHLAADGIDNVIMVLEDLENHRYGLEFVELNACSGGCVGGVLQVENPYIARAKVNKMKSNIKVNDEPLDDDYVKLMWDKELDYNPAMELGDTMEESFERFTRLQSLIESLPGLDCGSCGAPTCAAFAEDVVKGNAEVMDCVVLLRRKTEEIYKRMESSFDSVGFSNRTED